jgi:ABC-type branched-subunit amino acid transport system substrate-binding protein
MEIEHETSVRVRREGIVSEKPPAGLWRKNPETPEGKYLVKRRDGSVVEWPNFVLGAKDPAAYDALLAYADAADRLGFNEKFVSDVRALAAEFWEYRKQHGNGDADRGRHRKDDPATIAEMKRGGSA